MILVRNIRKPLHAPEEEAIRSAFKEVRVSQNMVATSEIFKVSVDARKGTPILVYTIALSLLDSTMEERLVRNSKNAELLKKTVFIPIRGKEVLADRPVVCGLGPAGLFAALLLAQNGLNPIVIERGPSMERRVEAVDSFIHGGVLDLNANIQFGEGGAGTFSDGKLTTRIGDELCGFVTDTFLRHGAPEEIAHKQKPHIGTDLLRNIICSIRNEIIDLGGEVRFETQLTGLNICNGKLKGILTNKGEIPCSCLVFAVGHSARDTFEMLMQEGIHLTCKPFSVGVRAEHLQENIDIGLYHDAAGHPALPKGEYQLSQHFGDRCVYTFCMCPGGVVVPAASEEGGVVTNGMSYHARNGRNANAAVVVSVNGDDFENDPRQAIAFQRNLECKAYEAGGRNYSAPAETLGSFIHNKGKLELDRVTPTYSRGVQECRLSEVFPQYISKCLADGLIAFGKKLPGYDSPDTVLTGVETRTSSPVRIERNTEYESLQVKGFYPCGEGAGYAGGIMSAAVDGLRVAEAILNKYK